MPRKRSDTQLLAMLRRRADKPITLAKLAKDLGMSDRTVSRLLTRLKAEGCITTAPAGKVGLRISIVEASTDCGVASGTNAGEDNPVAIDASNNATCPAMLEIVAAPLMWRNQDVVFTSPCIAFPLRRTTTPPDSSIRWPPGGMRRARRWIASWKPAWRSPTVTEAHMLERSVVECYGCLALAITVGAVGIALAWESLQINSWFPNEMAKTSEAKTHWANSAFYTGISAMLAFTFATALWRFRERFWSMLAFGAGLVALTYGIFAAAGFASVNLSDSMSRRDALAERRAAYQRDIERYEATIAKAKGLDAPGTIEAALKQAEPRAPKGTNGCRRNIYAKVAAACDPILKLRTDLETAKAAETAATALAEAQRDLQALPPVREGDPQAAFLAQSLTYFWPGKGKVTQEDVTIVRSTLIVASVEILVAILIPAAFSLALAALGALAKRRFA